MVQLVIGKLFLPVRVRITGNNIGNIVNIAAEERVTIKNVLALDNVSVEAEVAYFSLIRLKKRCKGKYSFKNVGYLGTARALAFALHRKTLCLLLIAFTLLIELTSSHTWFVKVYGSEDERIAKAVISNGMLDWYGNAVSKISECEKKIKALDKKILWCYVSINGATVCVYIKEDTSVPFEFETGDTIVASKDCVIRSITVNSGTANVQMGQTVKKGEVLILGKSKFGEREIEVVPKGTVLASVFYCMGADIVPEKQYKLSGRTQTKRRVSVFGIEVSDCDKCDFERYQVEEREIACGLLPIKAVDVIFSEVIEEQFDTAKAVEETEKALLARLYGELDENTTVLEKNTVVSENDGITNVSVYIETIENVAERK